MKDAIHCAHHFNPRTLVHRDGGWQPYQPNPTGYRHFEEIVDLSEDNLKLEKVDTYTGNSCSGSMLPLPVPIARA